MIFRLVERSNILGIVNLVVKGLIETSMQQGKTLNDAHPQLQQCLVAVEQALKHGLRGERERERNGVEHTVPNMAC